jgi:RpiR family carbohydrate utilization transcriptional regulator
MADILLTIREAAALPPAEQRVARVVLEDPAFATRASNAALAARAAVSEPTVTRFCRAVGCEGVRDFKLALARALAEGTPYVHSRISGGDEIGAVVDKVVDGLLEAVRHLKRQIDADQLQAAIDALAGTRRLAIFGVGAGSGIVAQDAELRFFRLDMAANSYTDSHLQLTAAALLGPGDCVIAISHTGRTQEIIAAAETARRNGATVIALTSRGSPLVTCSDIPIAVDVPENSEIYMPMVSRLLLLTVIDILSISVALRRGSKAVENLRKIKSVLGARRISGAAE